MRIVQVIDSLDTGGAERMAVNYANALATRIDFSGIVPTRAEGNLKSHVSSKVGYLFLGKRSAVDLRAVWRLRNYCKANRIDYIHAHSTSYFIAILVKLLRPKTNIIWHDHNGNSEYLEVREKMPLNVCSFFFKGIIVVNNQLKAWALRELHCRRVFYIANFTNNEASEQQETILQGNRGKKILHLANLREQKNHFLLMDVAEKIIAKYPDWTFHLVGKDFNDDYSSRVRKAIVDRNLGSNIIIYGSKNDTTNIISQCDIAILTSKSEGLPVALLEYGLQRKPVVITNVGEVPLIVRNERNGYIAPSKDADKFAEALEKFILDSSLRTKMGNALYKTIMDHHSEDAAMRRYLTWIESISNV